MGRMIGRGWEKQTKEGAQTYRQPIMNEQGGTIRAAREHSRRESTWRPRRPAGRAPQSGKRICCTSKLSRKQHRLRVVGVIRAEKSARDYTTSTVDGSAEAANLTHRRWTRPGRPRTQQAPVPEQRGAWTPTWPRSQGCARFYCARAFLHATRRTRVNID